MVQSILKRLKLQFAEEIRGFMVKQEINVVWFKRDLLFTDHEPLFFTKINVQKTNDAVSDCAPMWKMIYDVTSHSDILLIKDTKDTKNSTYQAAKKWLRNKNSGLTKS